MTCDFEILTGKIITSIEGTLGDDVLVFNCSDGSSYRMFHVQDCCEDVYLEDVSGEFEDVIGSPVLLAEVVSNWDISPVNPYDESYTWTFYKLSTNRGSITLRWYGTSNGYYSERVDFEQIS